MSECPNFGWSIHWSFIALWSIKSLLWSRDAMVYFGTQKQSSRGTDLAGIVWCLGPNCCHYITQISGHAAARDKFNIWERVMLCLPQYLGLLPLESRLCLVLNDPPSSSLNSPSENTSSSSCVSELMDLLCALAGFSVLSSFREFIMFWRDSFRLMVFRCWSALLTRLDSGSMLPRRGSPPWLYSEESAG